MILTLGSPLAAAASTWNARVNLTRGLAVRAALMLLVVITGSMDRIKDDDMIVDRSTVMIAIKLQWMVSDSIITG